MNNVAAILLTGFVMLAPAAALAKVGGGDITYTPKGAGKVIFKHELHVSSKGQKCSNCHYKTFQMTGGDAYKMDMATLTKGLFCGSCHDGIRSFDLKLAENCKRCHVD